jgi:hypothetical protein
MQTVPALQATSGYPFPVLPDGVHPCDELALRAHFVEPFPDSQTRAVICAGFFQLRSDAAARGIVATQWVPQWRGSNEGDVPDAYVPRPLLSRGPSLSSRVRAGAAVLAQLVRQDA